MRLDKSEQLQEYKIPDLVWRVTEAADGKKVATRAGNATYWSEEVNFLNCLVNSLLPSSDKMVKS